MHGFVTNETLFLLCLLCVHCRRRRSISFFVHDFGRQRENEHSTNKPKYFK